MDDRQYGQDSPEVISRGTIAAYIASLLATVLVAALGLVTGNAGDLILTIPIILILSKTIITDKVYVHIPPAMIFLMIGTFYFSAMGKIFTNGETVGFLASVLVGVNLELIGLVSVYLLLKSIPGVRSEKPRLVLWVSLSIAVAIFVMMKMLQYYLSLVWDVIDPVDLGIMMEEMLCVCLGAVVAGVLYMLNSTHGLFRYTVDRFLENNTDSTEMEAKDRKSILDAVHGGESDTLEFKSTLRTNLQTGETDKRMEKAVLKTIVAFLNSDGGTLMVGVSDDGSICGIDLDSFESRDRMNLHFTNMLSSSIGNEYLPYIRFNLVDFEDGKTVMRVDCGRCRKPVFLKDGKQEIFYVRSGPSSVELTGTNLLNYVRNRSRKAREAVLEKVS